MRRHSEQHVALRGKGTLDSSSTVQAVAKPSEVAKAAGTPNRLIVTRPAVGARALRASRSAHKKR
jgi:hypothetical protein